MSPNCSTRVDAAEGPERERLRPLLDAAAGDLGVLALQRARDIGDREVVGPQRVRRRARC